MRVVIEAHWEHVIDVSGMKCVFDGKSQTYKLRVSVSTLEDKLLEMGFEHGHRKSTAKYRHSKGRREVKSGQDNIQWSRKVKVQNENQVLKNQIEQYEKRLADQEDRLQDLNIKLNALLDHFNIHNENKEPSTNSFRE